MAPRQPRKPVTMTTEPKVMTRLAAEREGKEGENVAKLPWETDSQMPTPNNPQPDNWGETDRECFMLINTQKMHNHSVQQVFYLCTSFRPTLQFPSLKLVVVRSTRVPLCELKFTQGKLQLLLQDWGRYLCACLINKMIPVSALPAVRAI